MDESVYLNLAKADIVCALHNKSITIDEIKYLNRQLNDRFKTHIMVFEIYRNLNRNYEKTDLKSLFDSEYGFVSNVIQLIGQVCGYEIDNDFHTKLWLYSTYIKFNSNISIDEKGEYLKKISPSFYADKYFLLEYYNSVMDNVMEETPININKLNEVKNKIRELV